MLALLTIVFAALYPPALQAPVWAALSLEQPTQQTPTLYAKGKAALLEIIVNDSLNGTGFFISPGGYAITAAHVVHTQGAQLEARTLYGRVPLQLIAVDLGHDLALLKAAPATKAWPTLSLAETAPQVGADLFLLGTPINRHHVLFKGMVARDTPTYEYLPAKQRYVRVVHITGMSPMGTSGGPWMQANGEVVGVQSGLMHSNNAMVGVAHMAPLDAIRTLIRTGEDARTPSLGVDVEEMWTESDAFLSYFPPHTEGMVVNKLIMSGPTDLVEKRTGHLINQKVITHIDGHPVALRDDFLNYVRSKAPGDEVVLTVLDGRAKPITVKVRLDALERR